LPPNHHPRSEQLTDHEWDNPLFNRFPCPEDEISNGRFSAGQSNQRRDLAAMVPGMSKKLGENVLDGIPESAGVQALVVKSAREIGVAKPAKISRPGGVHFLDPPDQVRQAQARGEKVAWLLFADAESEKPKLPC